MSGQQSACDALERAVAASHFNLFDRVCVAITASSLLYLAGHVAYAWWRYGL